MTDLDDTLLRLRAYAEAGAEVLYAPGLPEPRRNQTGLRRARPAPSQRPRGNQRV